MGAYGACVGCGSYGRWGHPCPCNTPEAEWTPDMYARNARKEAIGKRGWPWHPFSVALLARASRADAYSLQEQMSRAYTKAARAGYQGETLKAVREELDSLYAEYRRWVEADSIAAQAGALD